MIEFTATLGVMSVRKELLAAPKTLFGIHSVFGDGNESARSVYMDWENLGSSSFLDDVMDGGIPTYPPSDVIIHHVTCVELKCI